MSLYKEEALKAIDKVFSDTSVPPQDTLDALEDIAAEIDMKIEALKSDLKDD